MQERGDHTLKHGSSRPLLFASRTIILLLLLIWSNKTEGTKFGAEFDEVRMTQGRSDSLPLDSSCIGVKNLGALSGKGGRR